MKRQTRTISQQQECKHEPKCKETLNIKQQTRTILQQQERKHEPKCRCGNEQEQLAGTASRNGKQEPKATTKTRNCKQER